MGLPPDQHDPNAGLTLHELAETTQESPRTLRYYVQLGLLAGPDSAGAQARYPASNVYRLNKIRQLQRDGLSLSKITEMLGAAEVERPVERQVERQADKSRGSISAYLQSESLLREAPKVRSPQSTRFEGSPMAQQPDSIGQDGIDSLWRTSSSRRNTSEPERTFWERRVLTTGVELLVRRPLDTSRQRQVARLLREAERIFRDDGGSDAEPF